MGAERKWVTAEQYDADRHDYLSSSFGPCQHDGCGHGEHYAGHRPPVTPQILRQYNALADYEEFVANGETGQVAARLAIEAAIEVRITPEAIEEFARAWHSVIPGPYGARRQAGLRAALAALGFEVIE